MAWRQRAVTSIAGASQIGTAILMGTVMAVYVGRDGSPFAVGMISTVYFLGMTVFAPVWGAIADITGRRRTVLVGTIAAATLCILPLTVAEGVWESIAIRGVYSVFAAGFMPVVLTIVSERGGDAARGRSLGSFNSARSVGFAGARFFAGVLLGTLAPASVYLVVAGVSLVTTVAVVLIDDPTPAREGTPTLGEVAADVRRRLLPAVGEREHLRTKGLGWLYVAIALRNAAWLGISIMLPVYLISEVGATELAMGTLLALAPVVEIGGMYLFGRASDGIGRKPLIALGVAGQGAVALVLAAAPMAGSPLAGQVVAGAGIVLKGLVYPALMVGALAFIGDVTPVARESELMGLRSTAKGVGGMLGPALIGTLATAFGFRTAFAAASVLAAAGAALVWTRIEESHPARAAASPADD